MRTLLSSGYAICSLLLVSTEAASARPMHVMNSTPAAETIQNGAAAQFVVRFDGPIDHAQSRLEILRDGQVIEQLHPRLESAPDVLYALTPRLEPGHYVLHWIAKSMPDRDDSDGMIPFSVSQ